MADSVLYVIRAVPGHGSHWREAVELALTGAAFGVPTTVWLTGAPLAHLARREDGAALLAELTGFGVRCVAARDDLSAPLAGVAPLDAPALAALRTTHDTCIVL